MAMQTISKPIQSPFTNQKETVPAELLWRMSVERYHAMIASGVLTDDDPIELLQGWLTHKMPKSPRHSTINRLVRKFLAAFAPDGWYVDSQEPITTFDSEPEPDVIIIRGDEEEYLHHHPTPEDIALVVEVSDATLRRDRTIKKKLYAAVQIPFYWIVNLQDNQIEVYSQPVSTSHGIEFQQRQTYYLTDEIPVIIDGEQRGFLKVSMLLPD